MAPNIFFNNFSNSGEQNLLADLIIESLGIYGIPIYYIPRKIEGYNELYGEDPVSEYDTVYMIDAYIRNVNGFGGAGDLMSKFGLQIRDSMTLTIAKRTFELEIGNSSEFVRPREGDLIYFPLNKKIFVNKFTEHEAIFYQLGQLTTYDLQCDLWEYSNEVLNTGVPEIDALQKNYDFSVTNQSILSEDGVYAVTDEDDFVIVQEEYDFETEVGPTLEDNTEIDLESQNGIIDFSEANPFGEIGQD